MAAEARLKSRAPIKGLNPSQRPRSAPAKAAWAMQTPIKERCMVTTKTPTTEQVMPPNSPARMAFCIKWYCKIDKPLSTSCFIHIAS
jgi:hypothetical protein